MSEELREELRLLRAEAREDLRRTRAAIESVRIEVAQLKVKSGLWGAVAGGIPSVAVLAMYLIGGH